MIRAALFLILAAGGAGASPALAGEQRQRGSDSAAANGGRSSGAVTINIAAGNGNQQANAGIFAAGRTGISTGTAFQENSGPPASTGRDTSARIADGAFAGSSGWQAINVVAGSGNQQANLALVAFGFEGKALTESMLGQTRAPTGPMGGQADAPSPQRSVAIGEGAFDGGRGLVQVSLVGGERNASANVFALSITGDAGQ